MKNFLRSMRMILARKLTPLKSVGLAFRKDKGDFKSGSKENNLSGSVVTYCCRVRTSIACFCILMVSCCAWFFFSNSNFSLSESTCQSVMAIATIATMIGAVLCISYFMLLVFKLLIYLVYGWWLTSPFSRCIISSE